MRQRRQRRVALVLVVACIGTGIGIAASRGSNDADLTTFDAGDAAAPWPQDTLQDWASYADQLSVVSVTDEEQLPRHEGDGGTGGYVGRAVTLKVERTLWRRPAGPDAGDTVRIITWGWIESDGDLIPGGVEDGVRLQMGERYLAPLTRRDGGEWTLFADTAVLTLSDGVVDAEVDAGSPSATVKSFKGQTPSEVARAVGRAEPDPLAKKYGNLPADTRWRAVDEESPD